MKKLLDRNTLATSSENKEEDVMELPCPKCGHAKMVGFERNQGHDNDRLRGLIKCECGGEIIFEMKPPTTITFFPGETYMLVFPNSSVPNDAFERFSEARICFFAAAPKAATVMLRSSVESALKVKGYTTGSLNDKINKAVQKKDITKRTNIFAHGSRLLGNMVIHEDIDVSLGESQMMFEVVRKILNELFPVEDIAESTR